jgi:hypothetical protein
MLVVLIDFDNNKDYLDYTVSTSQILIVYEEYNSPPLCFKGDRYETLSLELYSPSSDVSISSITFTKVGLEDSFFEDCYLTTTSESRDALYQPIASSRFKDGKLSFQFVDGFSVNEGRNVKIGLQYS